MNQPRFPQGASSRFLQAIARPLCNNRWAHDLTRPTARIMGVRKHWSNSHAGVWGRSRADDLFQKQSAGQESSRVTKLWKIWALKIKRFRLDSQMRKGPLKQQYSIMVNWTEGSCVAMHLLKATLQLSHGWAKCILSPNPQEPDPASPTSPVGRYGSGGKIA